MVGLRFSTFAVSIRLILKTGTASFQAKPTIFDPGVAKPKPSNCILVLENSVIIDLNCIT